MKHDLFSATNAARLDKKMIQKVPTHRLKAYRKKLLKVISKHDACECCSEYLEDLYPNDDWSHLREVRVVLDIVNTEYAKRS